MANSTPFCFKQGHWEMYWDTSTPTVDWPKQTKVAKTNKYANILRNLSETILFSNQKIDTSTQSVASKGKYLDPKGVGKKKPTGHNVRISSSRHHKDTHPNILTLSTLGRGVSVVYFPWSALILKGYSVQFVVSSNSLTCLCFFLHVRPDHVPGVNEGL